MSITFLFYPFGRGNVIIWRSVALLLILQLFFFLFSTSSACPSASATSSLVASLLFGQSLAQCSRLSQMKQPDGHQWDDFCGQFWLIFITRKSFSHRYLLPNIDKVRAAGRQSWGIAAGIEWMNCEGPAVSYFAFSVPLHCNSISSIWNCAGAVSTSMANAPNELQMFQMILTEPYVRTYLWTKKELWNHNHQSKLNVASVWVLLGPCQTT